MSTTSSTFSINIFIPTFIFSAIYKGHRSGLLFGYHNHHYGDDDDSDGGDDKSVVNFNITSLLPYESINQLDQLLNHLKQHNKHNKKSLNCKTCFSGHSSKVNDDDDNHNQDNSSKTIHFLGELYDDYDDDLNNEKKYSNIHYHNEQVKIAQLHQYNHKFQMILSCKNLSKIRSITTSKSFKKELEHHYSSIELISVHCFGRPIKDHSKIMIIYYDTKNFMSSQLLNRFNVEDKRFGFLF